MNGGVQVPDKVLSWLYSTITKQQHSNPQRTYSDLARALSRYPTLSPRTDTYNYENGYSALLLCLQGTLPVAFKGTSYRFPIILWIPNDYPQNAPLSYVTPTTGVAIRAGQHVGADGRIYHPYLANWAKFWDKSSITDFLTILQNVFAKEPPVVAKQQQQQLPPSKLSQGNGSITTESADRSASLQNTRHSQSLSYSEQQIAPPRPPKPGESQSISNLQTTSNHRTDSGQPAAPPLPPKPGRPTSLLQNRSQYGLSDTSAMRMDESSMAVSEVQSRTRYSQPAPLPNEVRQNYSQTPPVHQYNPHTFSQNFGSSPPSVPHTKVQTVPQMPVGYKEQPKSMNAPETLVQAPIRPIAPRQPQIDLMSTPLESLLPSQASAASMPAPPIPPNPEKDALLHAISSALHDQLVKALSQNNAALPALQAQNVAMQQAYHQMQNEKLQLEELNKMLDSNEKILHSSMREAERVMDGVAKRQVPAVDEVLVAPTVVGEQLYRLVAEERSIADAMFMLTRALDKGRIGGDVFVKQTRSLAREQFLKKALIKKIAQGMGLNLDTSY